MKLIQIEPVPWSEEKQHRLQEFLVGMWAEDTWELVSQKGVKRWMCFFPLSDPLKTELQYAAWYKFHTGEWCIEHDQRHRCEHIMHLVEWLNRAKPEVQSFMEKPLEYWLMSLRSYLVETNAFKQERSRFLRATQTYAEYRNEDARISLFRHLYGILVNAYDDRTETEKDVWDMRKLELPVNQTRSHYTLNFAPITQPWLRALAKEFMKYTMAVRSPGPCFTSLASVREFSLFLAHDLPQAQVSEIDRALVLKYLHFLQMQKPTVARRNALLKSLRTFLETCAYRLQVAGLTKERLIFEDDFAKEPEALSREIPPEVLEQLRDHLGTLDTTTLRMVTILLECGLRCGELCDLPLDCLVCDDRHEWYLRFYQTKGHKEHIIPLVDETVVGTIQVQQQDMSTQWGPNCTYLFPNARSCQYPYKQTTFTRALNTWAVKHNIRDRTGRLYRFQSHQFRHTLGMRLISDDVPLDVISRLMGHASLRMTERYARKRSAQIRAELERVHRKRKTVNYQGQIVKGDPRANDPDTQMVRKGIRGQTLAVGGCGRLVVLGPCNYANKCLTCPMWLTSTDDMPALKSFYARAIRLRQRAVETGNQTVITQQDHIITNLAVRIKSLEEDHADGTLCVDDILTQLRVDLAEARGGWEEAREAGLLLAAKHLERTIIDLKAKIEALEGAQ